MKYVHTNLVARDWKALSQFYQTAFGCVPRPPQRKLSGGWIDGMTGLKDVYIEGEHLALPGYDGKKPTLEIFTYVTPQGEELPKALHNIGFGHIAFEVEDVRESAKAVVAAGGSYYGEIVEKHYPELGDAVFVYMQDPEGNIIELQSWHNQPGG